MQKCSKRNHRGHCRRRSDWTRSEWHCGRRRRDLESTTSSSSWPSPRRAAMSDSLPIPLPIPIPNSMPIPMPSAIDTIDRAASDRHSHSVRHSVSSPSPSADRQTTAMIAVHCPFPLDAVSLSIDLQLPSPSMPSSLCSAWSSSSRSKAPSCSSTESKSMPPALSSPEPAHSAAHWARCPLSAVPKAVDQTLRTLTAPHSAAISSRSARCSLRTASNALKAPNGNRSTANSSASLGSRPMGS